jgi:hypothetical protein
LALTGIGQAGIVPGLEPALGAELSVMPVAALRLGAIGTVGFATSKSLAGPPGAAAEFTMWSTGVRACWQKARRWEFAACGTGEYGRITGKGRNIRDLQVKTDGFSALWVGLEGGYRLTSAVRFAVGLHVGTPLARPLFTVDGIGDVHRPELWLMRGTAGLVVQLP